ncbi:MAG: aldehyde dehydrogenase family protein, partial [bacterium]|nr:aldehyde dehydrogenase family protein [bacterium]
MDFLKELGIEGENRGVSTGTVWYPSDGQEEITVVSPGDGRAIASVSAASLEDYEKVLQAAEKAFQEWRRLPPPGRGEIVGEIAIKMRDHKASLGRLIAYEMGKSLQEGLGEVQEVIDICHFAVGQSRMLYGSTLHSERPRHRMYEQYHPLGPVAIVTAFNFPMAVWAWNAMIAAVCGDVTLWKPASAVPLSAVAIQKILGQVVKEKGLPEGLFSLLIGRGASLGDRLLADHRIPLISFTGSVATGRHAAEVVARRLGRTILELGGNNAIILTQHTNLELAIPAVVFGA